VRNWNSLLIEKPYITFVCFLYHLHPLFHMKVFKIMFSTLLSRRWSSSLRSIVQARGASIRCGRRGTRRIAPVSQGSNRHRLSHCGGAWQRRGLEPCLMLLTECCGLVWWCTLAYPDSWNPAYYSFWKHTNHIFSSLCIHFLSPSQFFLIQTQNLKNKKISIEVFKILKI